MTYLEIQRISNHYNDYIYINYLEIQRMINNYNLYIYIYTH